MFKDCESILILAPHPDDETIGCGGLISRAKKENIFVHVVYYSYVLLGIEHIEQAHGKETKKETRIKEIEEASKFGNFSYSIIDSYKNLDHRISCELISETEKIIKDINPDIICIPAQNSYNQDHRLVFESAITALRPLSESIRPTCRCVLEYEEPYSWSLNEAFKPNFFIYMGRSDMNFKQKLMQKHASQMRDDPHPRGLENVENLAKIRGNEVGKLFCEAYKAHRIVV